MVLTCKMCGGDLDLTERSKIATCQYCGTKQTLPDLSVDKNANLYERANQLRRQGEFDKAASLYEELIQLDTNDAEAYWSLVLCKYGVAYVQDPATQARIPTCNRTQYTSILGDEDFKQALEKSDPDSRGIYEAEAAAIDKIQKGILEISKKAEPFDIFICYKETDENGNRTPDSIMAQDLYYGLTDAGFKVFFARITLEGVLGAAYEPYIFAALHSSKIMIVLGTKSEYFNAVWVKNEWSRFLALRKESPQKILIPAYRDMDPHKGLPEAISGLQAQDMGKIGFLQDLIRNIKKVLAPEQAAPVAAPIIITNPGSNAGALLQRAYIEIEAGDFRKADELLEQVLNFEPQNYQAYLGKLLASLGLRQESELAAANSAINQNDNYLKALRFADEANRAKLQGYAAQNAANLEHRRKSDIYNRAVEASKGLKSAQKDPTALRNFARESRSVAASFRSIADFSNADSWAKEMEGRALTADKMAADEAKRIRRGALAKKLIGNGLATVIILAIVGFFVYFVVPPYVRKSFAKSFQTAIAPLQKKFSAPKTARAPKPKADEKLKDATKAKKDATKAKADVKDAPKAAKKETAKAEQKETAKAETKKSAKLPTRKVLSAKYYLYANPKTKVEHFTLSANVQLPDEEKPRDQNYGWEIKPGESAKEVFAATIAWEDEKKNMEIYQKLKAQDGFGPDILMEYDTATGKIINHGPRPK